jgi:hypothetical protein
MKTIWQFTILLRLLSTAGQRLPSPRVVFANEFEDSAVEGIVQDSKGHVYVTVNQKWQDGGGDAGFSFMESWVYQLDGESGGGMQSQLVGQNRSNLGACSLLADDSLLIINPGGIDSDANEGITAVQTNTLQVAWTSNVVRVSDRGVRPLISPTSPERVVYYSSNAGIAVLDLQGRTMWAATNVQTGRIEVTADLIFAVDKSPVMGFPLNVYGLQDGQFRGSSGALQGAETDGGVVLSPDSSYIYTVRSGLNGGLYRNRASFVFVPADVLSIQVSVGTQL